MRLISVGCLCAAAVMLNGCVTALKGRPELPIRLSERTATSPYAKQVRDLLIEAEAYEDFYDAEYAKADRDSDSALKLYRNDYGYTMLAVYELTYQHYAQRLQVEARGGAFALDATETALTFAGAVIDSAATKTILSTLVASLGKFETNYNSNLIVNNSITTILNNMLAEQTRARRAIISRFDEEVTKYPLSAVQLDLVAIGSVVTMEKALATSVDDSEQNLKDAKEEADGKTPSAPAGN